MLRHTARQFLGLGFRPEMPPVTKVMPRFYHERVVDHYNNPRNVGSFDKADPTVGTGLVGAPACGDVMKLQIKVDEKTGKITDACFKTFGCGSAIASSSVGQRSRETIWEQYRRLWKPAHAITDPNNPLIAVILAQFVWLEYYNALTLETTEWVKGKQMEDVVSIKNTEIAKHLSLPPVKLHCSMLAEDAIKAAVKDYEAKRAKSGNPQEASPIEKTVNA